MEIDLERVRDMAAEFCTREEIARALNVAREALESPAAQDAFARGRNAARTRLRHAMSAAADNGDRAMMALLAKNELGYQDNPRAVESGEGLPRIVDDIGPGS